MSSYRPVVALLAALCLTGLFAGCGGSSGGGIIIPQPRVEIEAAYSDAEGDSGTTSFDIQVTLSTTSRKDVTVQYDTLDGTAVASSDYTAVVAGTVTIPSGSTSATATVLVTGDYAVEPDETFTVTISNPANARLGTQTECTATITNDDAAPVADFTGSPAIGGFTTTYTFTNASTGIVTTYAWDFGVDASPATASTVGPHGVTYSTAGPKTVSLSVTGPSGSDVETKTDYITVYAAPVASFSGSPTGGGLTTTYVFTDASTGTITTWAWDFGADASPPTASTVGPHNVTYGSTGTKTISLTVTGPGGSDTQTRTDYVTVYAAPVADFTCSQTVGSLISTYTFTTATTGVITSWAWNFGAGASPASATTAGPHDVTYSSAGMKTISLTVTGPGGSDSVTKTDYVEVRHTIYVDGTRPDDTGDGLTPATAKKYIQSGIDAASDFCLVLVADGTYAGVNNRDLDFGGRLIHLKSAGGAANCIIDCGASGRGIYFHSGETNSAVVEGFTITNGSTVNGGAIYCGASSPIFKSCIISGNTATSNGGGICCPSDGPVFINCTITGNTAGSAGGGAQCNNSSAVFINCRITGNTATSGGGGIYSGMSDLSSYINCTISGNSSDYGGGVYGYNNTVTLQNSIIWGNTATTNGHQVYTEDAGATVTLSYTCYANGGTDVAGAGTVAPDHCVTSDPLFVDAGSGDYHVLKGSSCTNTGHDDYVSVSTDLDDRTRIQDAAVDIGCYEGGWLLVPSAYATIQDAIDGSVNGDVIVVANGIYTGTGNKDLDFGGRLIYLKSAGGAASCTINCEDTGRGFYFHNGEANTAVVEGFAIENGDTTGNGGGVSCESSSSPSFIGCVIADSTAATGGGGIECASSSSPVFINCTISGNTAPSGGGVRCYSSGNPTFVNCIITGNTATGSGGGVYCNTTSSTFTNCTISGNSAAVRGGGLFFANFGNGTLRNSIIWGNTAGTEGNQIHRFFANCVVRLYYCDYGNSAGDVTGLGTFSTTSCITTDPLFETGPLGNYYLNSDADVGADSPCIDAGGDQASALGLNDKTTRTDGTTDTGTVDIGYHYDP